MIIIKNIYSIIIFCISKNQFKQLTDDEYYVDINTSFESGDLLIGESVIKGETDREIILTSYYCHPMQVNDGLSGVLLLIKLYLRELTLLHLLIPLSRLSTPWH